MKNGIFLVQMTKNSSIMKQDLNIYKIGNFTSYSSYILIHVGQIIDERMNTRLAPVLAFTSLMLISLVNCVCSIFLSHFKTLEHLWYSITQMF